MNCSSSPVPSVATHQRLGLAAGEQRRAVGARQDADFGDDRADRLDVAAVDADAGVEDVPAHDLGFELLEHARRTQLGSMSASLPFREAARPSTLALAASTASWRSSLSGIS